MPDKAVIGRARGVYDDLDMPHRVKLADLTDLIALIALTYLTDLPDPVQLTALI